MSIEVRHYYGPPPAAIARYQALLRSEADRLSRTARTPAATAAAQQMLAAMARPLLDAAIAGYWPRQPVLILKIDGDGVGRTVSPSEFYRDT